MSISAVNSAMYLEFSLSVSVACILILLIIFKKNFIQSALAFDCLFYWKARRSSVHNFKHDKERTRESLLSGHMPILVCTLQTFQCDTGNDILVTNSIQRESKGKKSFQMKAILPIGKLKMFSS